MSLDCFNQTETVWGGERKRLASRLWKQSDKICQSWLLPPPQNNGHTVAATWPGSFWTPELLLSRRAVWQRGSRKPQQGDLTQRQSGFEAASAPIEPLDLHVGVKWPEVARLHAIGPLVGFYCLVCMWNMRKHTLVHSCWGAHLPCRRWKHIYVISHHISLSHGGGAHTHLL